MAEIDNYPSNSNKSKEASLIRERPVDLPTGPTPPVEVAPIQKPQAKRRITPVREVFAAIFPGGVEELKEHILWDVFVPWMQDVFHSGWESIGDVLFPGSGSSKGRSALKEQGQVSYDKPYRYSPPVSYDYYEEDGMRPLPTREQADAKLAELRGMLRRYGIVSLLDFNETVGNQTRPTQRAYGWINLDQAYVYRSRSGGFAIKMPPAIPID